MIQALTRAEQEGAIRRRLSRGPGRERALERGPSGPRGHGSAIRVSTSCRRPAIGPHRCRPACRQCSGPCGAGTRPLPGERSSARRILPVLPLDHRTVRTVVATAEPEPWKHSKSRVPTISRGGFAHRRDIEWTRHVPRIPVKERRDERAVDEAVLVDLPDRAESRVEPCLDVFSRDDADVGRQDAVERSRERCGIDCDACSPKVATCASAWTPASVRPAPWTTTAAPSIGTSASSSRPWIETPVLLPLPADERSAVVLNRDLQIAHQVAREPGFTTGMPFAQSGQDSGW